MKRTQIECDSLYGEKVMVPVEDLNLRPSAYGFVVNDGKLLVVQMKHTGKFWFPGGGLDKGETLEECVKREIWEETGIEVDVVELLLFKEIFFYYNPENSAYHNFAFIYLCRPRSLETTDEHVMQDEGTENAQWIDMDGSGAAFSPVIVEALDVYRNKNKPRH